MQFMGVNDTDATTSTGAQTWRKMLRGGNTTLGPRWSGIFGSTLVEGVGSGIGALGIAVLQGGSNVGDSDYRWEDTTLLLYEPLVGWATGSSASNEGRIKGQLWDAIVVSGTWTSETTVSFDGHNFIAITDTATASLGQTQTLFIAVT
jgi:hypothetical protein